MFDVRLNIFRVRPLFPLSPCGRGLGRGVNQPLNWLPERITRLETSLVKAGFEPPHPLCRRTRRE